MDEESQSALNDIRRGVMALGYTKIFFTEFDLIAVTPYEVSFFHARLKHHCYVCRRISFIIKYINYQQLYLNLGKSSTIIYPIKYIGLGVNKIFSTINILIFL